MAQEAKPEAQAQQPAPDNQAAAQTGAEAAPAEAQPQSAQPVDDRPLPPPPPGYGGAQGYQPQGGYGQQSYNSGYGGGAYQPQPSDGVYRPFSFTVGLGAGFLGPNNGPDTEKEFGIAYAVRFGFGVAKDLLLTLGFEGTSASKEYALPADRISFSQDAFLVGLQYFPLQVLYIRGAVGLANESQKYSFDRVSLGSQNGLGLQGAVGVDLIQGANVALSLEASVLLGYYTDLAKETWTGGGLNLLVSLY